MRSFSLAPGSQCINLWEARMRVVLLASIDAVEKVADDLRERFHLTFLGSGFVSVFVSFSVGTTDMGAGVQLSQVGSTDAQATHVAGMFSHGRQIWLARVFKF